MTANDAPDLLETRLRAALAELRPGEGAADRLRERVEAMPDQLAANGILARLRRLAVSPVVVAALATAASIALLTFAIHPITGPANMSGANAPAATFDPTAEGPGLVYEVIPTLVIVPGLVAIIAIAFATSHVLRSRWIGGGRGAVWLGVLAVIAAGGITLALQSGFYWGGGSVGPVLGYGVQVNPPPGSIDAAPVWYETASPGDPLVLVVSITNPGPLPIQLEGIVEDPQARERVIARWIDMTYATDQTTIPQDLSKLPAFTPRVVQPDEQLLVYLVARAGSCSFGPDFTLGTQDPGMSGYSTRSREIRFAYSVFGLTSTAPFELPVTLVEPMRNGCPG
jgi:hypothetical protein